MDVGDTLLPNDSEQSRVPALRTLMLLGEGESEVSLGQCLWQTLFARSSRVVVLPHETPQSLGTWALSLTQSYPVIFPFRDIW